MIFYSGSTFFCNNYEVVIKIFHSWCIFKIPLICLFDKDFKCTSLYFTSVHDKYNKIEVDEWEKKTKMVQI
jgi:hypothetical protein